MKKSLSKKQSFFAIGIIVVATAALVFLLKSKNANKETASKNPIVKTMIAEEAAKNDELEISGFVRGTDRADISPLASGTIVKILKHEGESVKKGEILAIIRNEQVDAQVVAAAASVSALEKTLNDSKKYYDQLVKEAKTNRDADPSDSNDEMVRSAQRARDLQIQAAKDQLILAQGSADIAKAGKNNFTLVAPFAGKITAVYGREGGFANFSMPLFNLSTPNKLEIETYVSTTAGKNISLGNPVSLMTSNGAPLAGIVTAVSPGSDSMSLKTLVRIKLDDTTSLVSLGDFLHGKILATRGNQTVSIPRSAVVSRGGDQIVFVLDENNLAKEQAIKIAGEHSGLVEVTEGIDLGQRIVTEGQQYLINGITTTPYETN